MIKKLLLIGFLCCASLGWGQTVHAAGWETQNVFTNTNQFLLGLTVGPVVTANLGTLSSLTTLVYVSDGKPGSNPCVGGGPGALAVQIGGIWTCGNGGGYSPAGSLQLQVSSANGAAFTAPIPNAVPGSNLVSTGSTPAFQTKPVLDARDFGTPNGSNAGDLIQAAINSSLCGASTGCVIDARGFGATDTIAGLAITKPVQLLFGATNFSVTSTMTWTNVVGPSLIGAGNGNQQSGTTTFTWAGGSAQVMRWISVAKADFEGYRIICSTAVPCTAAMTSERGAAGNPTDNAVTNVTGDCTDGGCTNGFAWPIGAGGDAGNDNFLLTNVQWNNYSNACWYNPSTQSQIHAFVHSSCNSNGYGKYGYQGTGSFVALNMVMGGNTVSDYEINPNNGVLISGGISIGSCRFYEDGISANTYPVTIEGINFSTYSMCSDGKVVKLGQAGPYLIRNNETSANVNGYPVQFYYAGDYAATAEGNSIQTTLTNPFTPAGAWELLGLNSVSAEGGNPTMIPEYLPLGLGIAANTVYKLGPGTGISQDQILGPGVIDFGNGTLGSTGATIQTANAKISTNLTLNSAPALVANGCAELTGTSQCGTTLGSPNVFNTIGATLIVVQLNGVGGDVTISGDTPANTWTYLTGYNDGSNYIRYAYVCGPNTSTTQYLNFSGGGTNPGFSALAWAFSGVPASACFDTASGANSALTSPLQPGSITVLANDIVFTGCAAAPPNTSGNPVTGIMSAASVNDSFSPALLANGIYNEQAAGSYLAGTSAGALNPTIMVTGQAGGCVPAIAAFKASTTTPATMTLGAGSTITMTGAPSDSYVKADGTGYGTPSSVTLVGQTGTLASSCDNHVASGTGTLQQYGSSPEAVYNVAFSDGANFCDANYSIHVFRTSAPCGFGNGTLYGQNKTAFGFTVVSTDTTELTCTFDWSTAGYQ